MKTPVAIVALLAVGTAVAQVSQRGQSTPITPAVPTTPTTPTTPFTVPGQEPIRPLPPVGTPILPGATAPGVAPGTQIPGTTQLPGTQFPGTLRQPGIQQLPGQQPRAFPRQPALGVEELQLPGTTQLPRTQTPGQRFRNVPATRPPGFFQNVPAARPPGFFDPVPGAGNEAFGVEPGVGNNLFPERGVQPRGQLFPERGVEPGLEAFPDRGLRPRGELFPNRGVQPTGDVFPEGGVEPRGTEFPNPGVEPRGNVFPDTDTAAPLLTPGDQSRINRLALGLQNLSGASRVTISQRQQLLNALRSMARGPNPPPSTLMTRLANNLVVAVPQMNLGPGGLAQLSADIHRVLNSDQLRPQDARIVLNDAQQLLALSGIGQQESQAIFNSLLAIASNLQRGQTAVGSPGSRGEFGRGQQLDRFDQGTGGQFDRRQR